MASLVKDSRSPFYWARFRDSTGREFTRSTRERVRVRAMEVAVNMENSVRLVDGEEFDAPPALPMLRLVEAEPAAAAPPSILEEVENFASSAESISGIPIENKLLIAPIFIDYLGSAIAALPLRSLSRGLLDGYRACRQNIGIKKNVLNLELRFLRSLCQLALEEGRLVQNIAEQIQLEPEESVVIKPFSQKEFSKLMRACHFAPHGDAWRCLIAICMMTGQPLASVAALRILNLNGHEGTASLQFGLKGYAAESETTLEFHPLLLEYLFLHNLSNDSEDFIFPSLANRPLDGPVGLLEEFATLMESAGIDKEVSRTTVDGISVVSCFSARSLEHALPIAERNAVINASFQKHFRASAEREEEQQDQSIQSRNASPRSEWTRFQRPERSGTRAI